jgi:hypothetical protein
MLDVLNNKMYEVEVMLGKLDESHIIRTIEYWDIERRRWSDRQHTAVIVAEEITNRFFNVIGLFNRAIPIIAIQLNALQIDDKVVLTFTKVLDVYESPDEGIEDERADRKYWEGRSSAQSMKIFDQCVSLLGLESKRIQVNYRTSRITLEGSAGQIFAWFYPRRVEPQCLFQLRTGEDNLQSVKSKLEGVGIDVVEYKRDRLRVIIRPDEMKQYEDVVRECLIASLRISEEE